MDNNARLTFRALIVIVFFTYIGQNLLNTSLAPMARIMHLPEWIMGGTVSLAALMVTLLSQRWGRLSLSWGRRPVLISALVLACAAGYVFAATAWAATHGLLAPTFAAVGVLISRGVFFGAAVAAVPPTGQALIAAITPDEKSRVRGMAHFGGAFNASIMVGSLLSALLAAMWVMAPVYSTPLMVTIALIIAIVAIPRTPRPETPVKAPGMRPNDPRILPFVISGFGLYFTLGTVQILLGFLIQDRLAYPPNQVIGYTGLIMLIQAAGAMIAQLVVVPRLVWPPVRLMRTGLTVAVTGLALTAIPFGHIAYLGIAAALLGIGVGMFSPGYTAGASLAVSGPEQGSVAGLLNATNATTWILAPITATSVYGWNIHFPFVIAGLILLISFVTAWTHPQLRRTLAKIHSEQSQSPTLGE